MKILVLGAGYVGGPVAYSLARGYNKHDVTMVDSLIYGPDTVDWELTWEPAGIFIRKDIRSLALNDYKGYDVVYFLAGLSNDPTSDFSTTLNTVLNYETVKSSAKLAKEAGVKKYIFASSCSLYDRGINSDIPEECNEESSIIPNSNYSKSKYLAETALLDLHCVNFQVIIFRKGTVCGLSKGRMRFDLVLNTMIKDALVHHQINLHNGGLMWRPLLGINDAIKAYEWALFLNYTINPIYNIVTQNYRIADLALMIHSITGAKIKFVENKSTSAIRNYRVNSDLSYDLGMQYKDNFYELAEEIYKKYKNVSHLLEHPKYYNLPMLQLCNHYNSELLYGKS